LIAAFCLVQRGKLTGKLNSMFGSHYSGAEISNVSHFFEAMAVPTMGGHTPIGAAEQGLVLSVLWDLVYSPLDKLQNHVPASKAFHYDYEQFKNYDATGIEFGLGLAATDLAGLAKRKP
jgi:hypothetical protein